MRWMPCQSCSQPDGSPIRHALAAPRRSGARNLAPYSAAILFIGNERQQQVALQPHPCLAYGMHRVDHACNGGFHVGNPEADQVRPHAGRDEGIGMPEGAGVTDRLGVDMAVEKQRPARAASRHPNHQVRPVRGSRERLGRWQSELLHRIGQVPGYLALVAVGRDLAVDPDEGAYERFETGPLPVEDGGDPAGRIIQIRHGDTLRRIGDLEGSGAWRNLARRRSTPRLFSAAR